MTELAATGTLPGYRMPEDADRPVTFQQAVAPHPAAAGYGQQLAASRCISLT
jgi:hypothetical protein